MTTEISNPANPLRVRFTRKPVDLHEVLATTPYDERPEPVVISETRELTAAEYDVFAGTLLQDRDWLAGKGGYVGQGRLCVEVHAPGRPYLYVDPSGGDYARYAARLG